jgi:hypothetical protein
LNLLRQASVRVPPAQAEDDWDVKTTAWLHACRQCCLESPGLGAELQADLLSGLHDLTERCTGTLVTTPSKRLRTMAASVQLLMEVLPRWQSPLSTPDQLPLAAGASWIPLWVTMCLNSPPALRREIRTELVCAKNANCSCSWPPHSLPRHAQVTGLLSPGALSAALRRRHPTVTLQQLPGLMVACIDKRILSPPAVARGWHQALQAVCCTTVEQTCWLMQAALDTVTLCVPRLASPLVFARLLASLTTAKSNPSTAVLVAAAQRFVQEHCADTITLLL